MAKKKSNAYAIQYFMKLLEAFKNFFNNNRNIENVMNDEDKTNSSKDFKKLKNYISNDTNLKSFVMRSGDMRIAEFLSLLSSSYKNNSNSDVYRKEKLYEFLVDSMDDFLKSRASLSFKNNFTQNEINGIKNIIYDVVNHAKFQEPKNPRNQKDIDNIIDMYEIQDKILKNINNPKIFKESPTLKINNGFQGNINNILGNFENIYKAKPFNNLKNDINLLSKNFERISKSENFGEVQSHLESNKIKGFITKKNSNRIIEFLQKSYKNDGKFKYDPDVYRKKRIYEFFASSMDSFLDKKNNFRDIGLDERIVMKKIIYDTVIKTELTLVDGSNVNIDVNKIQQIQKDILSNINNPEVFMENNKFKECMQNNIVPMIKENNIVPMNNKILNPEFFEKPKDWKGSLIVTEECTNKPVIIPRHANEWHNKKEPVIIARRYTKEWHNKQQKGNEPTGPNFL